VQIVNPKGEMKGSAITGPVGKEAAELWPVCHASSRPPSSHILTSCPAYCVQLWCRDVREENGIREDYAATVFRGELGVAHNNDVRAVMNTKTNTLSMIKPEESAAVLRRVTYAVVTCRWKMFSGSHYA